MENAGLRLHHGRPMKYLKMILVASLLPLIIALFAKTRLTEASRTTCNSFNLHDSSVPFTVTSATFFSANERVNITNPFSSIDVDNLPAFCRVEVAITTNITANSKAHAEVWLPESWNGRFVGFGNGGFGGGVNVADLGFVAITQGFAGMSTDTGHLSASDDGSWAGPHNDNAIVDWAWRAMRLSVIASKQVVEKYYGKPHQKAYYLGCSTGGRQGLLEAQRFPTDFDGVVVGSPAEWMSHLQPWSIHVSSDVMPINSPHWIPATTWTDVIHPEVLAQCDSLDGLADGIINDPRKCSFRPETLTCRQGQNLSTCLTIPQIEAVHKIYSTYYETDQTFIFNGYYPGGELGYPQGLVGEVPFAVPPNYYRYFVLNDTTWTQDLLNFTVIKLGEEINPGTMDANSPDLSSFAGEKHNGKILQYVGWADQLISPGNSIHYYDSVNAFTRAHTDLEIDNFYRLFTVPGMVHCQGGLGANAFGGSGQAAGGMPPASLDAEHNILGAMVQWVEKGIPPETLTSTYWKNNTVANGVGFTRPLCKYPLNLVYTAGDPDNAKSFQCV